MIQQPERIRVISIINVALAVVALSLLLWQPLRNPGVPVQRPPAVVGGQINWAALSDEDLEVAGVFAAARRGGVGAGLDSLQAIAARDSSVLVQGHALAHAVGRFVMARNGADPAILARCRPVFEAGCYHGVLEGYLASVKTVDAARLTSMCAALLRPGESRLPAHECAHGLGHGLVERLSYDFRASLGSCDAFADESLRGECHDGAFMQNAVRGLGLDSASASAGSAEHHHGAAAPADQPTAQPIGPFRASNLAFPCDSVAASYQPSCWAYQPLAIVQLVRADFEKTLRACDLAPAPTARARCFAGVGKQSTGWFLEDARRVIDLCRRAGVENVDNCLGGAVETLIDANWTPDAALAFCRQVPGGAKPPCYRMIGERMRLVRASEEAVHADCGRAEATFVNACLEGSRRTHD
jgi:hypothetical protein